MLGDQIWVYIFVAFVVQIKYVWLFIWVAVMHIHGEIEYLEYGSLEQRCWPQGKYWDIRYINWWCSWVIGMLCLLVPSKLLLQKNQCGLLLWVYCRQDGDSMWGLSIVWFFISHQTIIIARWKHIERICSIYAIMLRSIIKLDWNTYLWRSLEHKML